MQPKPQHPAPAPSDNGKAQHAHQLIPGVVQQPHTQQATPDVSAQPAGAAGTLRHYMEQNRILKQRVTHLEAHGAGLASHAGRLESDNAELRLDLVGARSELRGTRAQLARLRHAGRERLCERALGWVLGLSALALALLLGWQLWGAQKAPAPRPASPARLTLPPADPLGGADREAPPEAPPAPPGPIGEAKP